MATASSARKITNKASAGGGKRKFVDDDPVASSSSSSSSSSDDDAPATAKRTKRGPANKRKAGGASSSDRVEDDADGGGGDVRRRLKPLFEVEDRVYAAWWPDERSQRLNRDPTWHPGVVKGYATDARKRRNGPSPYGPTRFYDILYDDGDELEGVADHYIFPRADYLLSTKDDGGSNWVGVRNETDGAVDDKWARIVGWYVATIDGEERPFTYLSDAMDAYDNWATEKWARDGTPRANRRPSDLNRPELYSHLFEEESVSDDGGGGEGEEDDDSAEDEGERGSPGENRQDDTDIQWLERNDFQSSERNDSAVPSPPTMREESSPDEDQNRDASPSPRKRRRMPNSAYRGISYSDRERKYSAQIIRDAKVHRLGYYEFEADAALAADKGSVLGSSSRERPNGNFSTRKEYEDAICTEMESRGRHPANVEESYDAVVEKVRVYLSKIYAAGNANKTDEDSDADEDGSATSDGRNRTGGRQNEIDDTEAAGKTVADAKIGNDEAADTNPDSGEDMEVSSGSQNATRGGQSVNSNEDAGSPCKNGKYYDFVGYIKAGDRYRSYVYVNSKCRWLGTYELEVDAAYAHDEAARELKMPEEKANFATSEDYEKARLGELRRRGRGADDAASSTAIASKVAKLLSKASPSPAKSTNPNRGNRNSERKSSVTSETRSEIADDVGKERDSNDDPDAAVAPDNPSPATSAGDKFDGWLVNKTSSDYAGVSYNVSNKPWLSRISQDGRHIDLGTYKLEADAAYARDEAARLLRMTGEMNFSAIREHEDSKLRELERTGFGTDDAMSSAAIASKVAKILLKESQRSVDRTRPKGNCEAAETASREPKDSPPSGKAPLEESNVHQKRSKFTGVAYKKRSRTYTSQIRHGGKQHHLGNYKLQSDAAIAYDEAAKLLRGADRSKVNFSSGRKDYADARTNELEELEKSGRGSGASAESPTDIASRIRKCLSKIPCPEIVAMNDAMARKWARHLPTETGREYLVSYGKAIEDALHLTPEGRDASAAPSVVSDRRDDGRASDAEVESVPDRSADALVKPIGGGDTDDLSGKSGDENTGKSLSPQQHDRLKPVEESDDDASAAPSVVSDRRDDSRASDAEAESVPDKSTDALVKPIGGGDTDDLSGKSGDENTAKSLSPQQHDRPKPVDESNDDVCLLGDTVENDARHPKPVDESDDNVSLSGDTDENDAIHPKPVDESDDDVSLFSDKQGNGAGESVAGATATPDTNCKAILPAPSSHDENIVALPDRKKEFPIGCPVLWHFDGSSFCRGIVTSAPIRGADGGATYEVTPTESQCSAVMPEKSLGYGVNCPVYVSRGSESHPLKGKILFCKTRNSEAELFSYTVVIKKEGNQFQVMNDVTPERVKYRDVTEAEAPVPTNKSTAPADTGSVAMADAGSVAINSEVPSRAKKNSSAALASAAEEVGSRMSSPKFFSSNSTITSVDSATASSRRATADGTRCHEKDGSVEVAVYVPHWLVHDSEAKRRLISHLLRVDKRVSNYQCLQRIGRKTHCTLRIVERGDFHVLIQTRSGKYATEDIRKAGEKLENVLLEHIRHDGSAGRLFYNLARSCEFLHPKGSARSTSVMQRNPFTKNNEMGWTNIVELPYAREAGDRKRYHGHYLIGKKSGVLRRIKHETRCEIRLCGDEFNVPTELCVPYIWIMGDRPGLADKAVDILQEAIGNHIVECRCAL